MSLQFRTKRPSNGLTDISVVIQLCPYVPMGEHITNKLLTPDEWIQFHSHGNRRLHCLRFVTMHLIVTLSMCHSPQACLLIQLYYNHHQSVAVNFVTNSDDLSNEAVHRSAFKAVVPFVMPIILLHRQTHSRVLNMQRVRLFVYLISNQQCT
jgi:hypothetical protein